MREMSNREIHEVQQQQYEMHKATYGEESARKHFPQFSTEPDTGGIDWFSKLTFFGIAICVIGMVIQSMIPGKPVEDDDGDRGTTITLKEEGTTETVSNPSDSSSSSEALPYLTTSNQENETPNGSLSPTQPERNEPVTTRPQPKIKEPPRFDSTGRLDSFPRAMTIDCLKTNDAGSKLYAGVNDSVIEYDLKTGERLRLFTGHEGEITSLSVFDQSRKMITGSNDKTAIIWNLETGEQLHQLSEQGTVGAVAGSFDGTLVATSALSKNPIVWSVDNGQPVKRTKIESWPWNSQIKALTFDRSGKYLIGGGSSYNAHIWSLPRGDQKGIIYAHKNQYVLDLSMSPDGDSLVMLDAGGVKVFETRRYQEKLGIDFDVPKQMQAIVSPDNSQFVAVNGVYDLNSGNLISRAEIPLRSCRTVTATLDGKRFIYATSNAIEVIATK